MKFLQKVRIKKGKHVVIAREKNVVVVPIRSRDGKAVVSLGIVDMLTTIDLPAVFQEYLFVLEEVENSKK